MRAQSAERRAQSLLCALFLATTPLAAQSATPCVAAKPLARGVVLGEADIASKDGSALCALRSALVGAVAQRVIAAGEVLRQPAVAPPVVITANQPVSVFWRDAGIEVRLKGTAMNAAPLGARVMVHVDVRRRLEGVAIAPGLVQIK